MKKIKKVKKVKKDKKDKKEKKHKKEEEKEEEEEEKKKKKKKKKTPRPKKISIFLIVVEYCRICSAKLFQISFKSLMEFQGILENVLNFLEIGRQFAKSCNNFGNFKFV